MITKEIHIFKDSDIKWDLPVCPDCFCSMPFHKSNKKKRIRNIPNIGLVTLRDLGNKYLCPNCNYSQLPETDRDKAIRIGLIE